MKKKTVFFIIILLFLISSLSAKDCPSRLFANLNQVGDSNLFWGLELKSFFYNIEGENYYFGGLSGALSYETDTSSIQFEGMLKKKKYTPCNNLPELSPFQIRRLNIEKYFSDSFSLTLGRQEISLATGFIIDDFFDGLSFKTGEKTYFSGGLGVYSIYIAREATGCQKCFFYNYRPCWKNLSQTEWGDITMGFLNYNFRIKKSEFGIIYLRTQSKDVSMTSNTASVYSKIRFSRTLQLFSEFAIQHFEHNDNFAFGFNGDIQKRIRLSSIGTFLLKLRYMFGSTGANSMFTPIFGNTYIGEREHYTVRQGSIYGAELKFNPSFLKTVKIKFGYYLNSQEGAFNFISDEFDSTLEINLDKREKFKILSTYAIWSGVNKGSQISLNLRIVL